MSAIAKSMSNNVLDELQIPPQPEILLNINNELENEYPNINKISDEIVSDAGLFSSILKLINSPYFGMRVEIKSIEHAVSLIGLDNLSTHIASILFRSKMKEGGFIPMPRYWDTSLDMARLCGYLAKELNVVKQNEAYSLGLFQDCGIPLLAQKYSDYKSVLSRQNSIESDSYTCIEDETYQTNHCVIGFYLGKAWGLNKHIRNACLHHHDIEYMTGESKHINIESKKLILMSKMAENVLNLKRKSGDKEWEKIGNYIIDYFGLSEHDYYELSEEMLDYLDGI